MKKDDSLTLESVAIEFNAIELAILTNVLDRFFDQNDEVFKSVGIDTDEMQVIASDLYARLDSTFHSSFNEGHILREMWGER